METIFTNTENTKTNELHKLVLNKTLFLIRQNKKNEENVRSLELAGLVLVQCNLADNQYQQKSEVLYTFTLNKSYAYWLNFKFSVFENL